MLKSINIKAIEFRVKVQILRTVLTDLRIAVGGMSSLGVDTKPIDDGIQLAIRFANVADAFLLAIQDASHTEYHDGLPF